MRCAERAASRTSAEWPASSFNASSCKVKRRNASGNATSGGTASRLARLCASDSSNVGNGARTRGAGSEVWESACLRATKPTPRVATMGITGTPSRSLRAGTSINTPACSAISTMLSATISGNCSSNIWATKYRFRSRLVASITATITSGRATPGNRPRSTSRATASSGERICKL